MSELEAKFACAVAMLADWCARVEHVGTGWDDWDEAYKDARYRPCAIRAELDAAIASAAREYVRDAVTTTEGPT
jgi:hypothetical protein